MTTIEQAIADSTTFDKPFVRLTDSTLRDGSHAVRHQFTIENVTDVVTALDTAGISVIEVTHGDGLAGSSFNYGFGRHTDVELVSAAVRAATRAKIAVLVLPGLGTVHDLKQVHGAGARIARVATHCTEADVSVEHFTAARELGMETVGFLMLSHRIGPEQLAAQARVMADAGCQCVYVVDSAGALLPDMVRDRVQALVAELGDDAQVGFHGHQNLSLGVANSIVAYENGARQIDGTLCALGAGAGNSPTEILATAFDVMGIPTGVDAAKVLDAAEEIVKPMITRLPIADRASIVQGRYGVYNSFLLHAERAADRYGVSSHEILRKVGEAGYVGGQEDMIIDVAIGLAAQRTG
ncbi:4-hydroxy-2-oxovalerate aldolase [Nakamurella sp.]|uniref:4-hydroxy-2-oxovalerate aldolase n=1 Tax=Nakamurella sp. TaxID=1869182 RepID=UPI003B3A7D12